MRVAESPLRFFLDRGLGSRIVPGLLRTAGWPVVTMDERYGIAESQRVPDEQWIADASERAEVILSKDLAIARNQIEAETVHRSDARVFGLANANLSAPDAVACLLAFEAEIVAMAIRAPRPYVVSVSARGLRRCRLNLG